MIASGPWRSRGLRRSPGLRRWRRADAGTGDFTQCTLPDHELGLAQGIEDCTVEALVAQLAVEAFAVAALRRAAVPVQSGAASTP